jgi:P4 family phage/plasmid primase-like protien
MSPSTKELVKKMEAFATAVGITVSDNASTEDHGRQTPAKWFAERFPHLPSKFGEAIHEEVSREGIVVVKDICEPFLAATLGAEATPQTPTVFLPAEDKFYTYVPAEGIYLEKRNAALLTYLSSLLLEAARACPSCATKSLEFRFRDSASLFGILQHARGQLAQSHDFFAQDLTEFLPCATGMLRLKDKHLLPFSPDYRRRNKLAVDYNPSAKCPLFFNQLMQPALGAEELELLQRWCGLALIGENLAQRILILTGTAGGGKGTFIRVLQGVIGAANIGGLRTQLLGERFEIGRFLGKTLLYGADVPEDFLNRRGASVLKSLSGADPMTLEFKNSNASPSITCRFNIVVTSNSRLTVHLEGDTAAWRRRLAIIEYRNPPPPEKVAALSEMILRDEAAGVLNWMLEGLDKIRADGWQLHLNETQQKIVDDLLLESDGHTVFVKEALVRDGEASLTAADCYTAYVEFCANRGWMALPKNRFTSLAADAIVRHFALTSRNDILDESNKAQRGWKGIRCR